jgi:hypothetical protein
MIKYFMCKQLFQVLWYHMSRLPCRFLTLPAALSAALLTVSCLFPLNNGPADQPFQLTRVGNVADSIAPFGALKLVFTRPVRNPDSVDFAIRPYTHEFQILFNASRDTVSLLFTVPLEGNTKYSITATDPIAADDGAMLYPWEDTVVVCTYPTEQEPNNSRALADTLKGRRFGSITAANDTDWFVVPDGTADVFYLVSTATSSTFDLFDATGTASLSGTFAGTQTLTVPLGFVRPLYVSVHAWNRSNGGYYEVGWVER